MAAAIGSVTIDGFVTGKADVSEENRQKLKETARTIQTLLRKYPGSTINITGHTDAIDTPEYNMELGNKRAEATREELQKMEIPSDIINTGSKGESELLIKTKKAEPRNRRVEVRFKPYVSQIGTFLPELRIKPPLGSKEHETIPNYPPEKPRFDYLNPGPDILYPRGPLPPEAKSIPDWFWKLPPATRPPEYDFSKVLEDISVWATKDIPIPDWFVGIAEAFGVEDAKKKLKEALAKGGKAALEKAFSAIVEKAAGPPSGRPPEGPPIPEKSLDEKIFKIPVVEW